MEYILVKQIHMAAASLSFLGFLIRGFWMISENSLLQAKVTKILPHIIDTVLLVTAISLVIILQAYPFEVNWITAKVLFLVAYIVIGTIALKRGKTKKIRIMAFVVSLIIILAIFAIAVMKPALSF